MTERPERANEGPDLSKWAALCERSARAVQAFLERQSADGGFQAVDPAAVGRAFMALSAGLMRNPAALVDAQMRLWQQSLELWQAMGRKALGEPVEPLARPAPGDRRFKDKAWDEELVFDYLKQSYLLVADWARSLVAGAKGLDPESRRKVDFYTRQYLSAIAPSNFALGNPAVLRRARETKGGSLLDGLRHLLDDLERGEGRLAISMTDRSAFGICSTTWSAARAGWRSR